MLIETRTLTASEAAEQFARTAFGEPRRISRWIGNRFKLVDGRQWYAVNSHPRGWQIVSVMPERGTKS